MADYDVSQIGDGSDKYILKDAFSRRVLSKLVDGLQKNVLDLTIAETQTLDGVTFTVNSDLSITCTGQNTSNAAVFFSVASSFPKGRWKFTGMPGTGGTSSYRMELRTGTPKGTVYMTCETKSPILIQAVNPFNGWFNIRVASGYNFGNTGVTLKPMICDEDYYALSTEYVPHHA